MPPLKEHEVMTPVVRASQLVRYYPAVRSDPVKAVDCVDLQLPPGELAVLSGPSGSGKTTLLGLLAGLDRPNSGRVELFGQAMADLSDAALALLRRTRIGLVFQDFKLLRGMSCWENVSLPLVPAGTPTAARRQRANDWLQRMEIAHLADRFPEQLSGGQQQRVAVARALIDDPDLVLADEPTSQIDADSAANVLAALGALPAQGKTVLIATHDPSLFPGPARRLCISAGRLETQP
jgi:putative ABC transport system ATP-binding protein